MEMTAYANGAPCWIDRMTTNRRVAVLSDPTGWVFSIITMART